MREFLTYILHENLDFTVSPGSISENGGRDAEHRHKLRPCVYWERRRSA